MSFSHDTRLNDLRAKVKTGERLSFEDGVALFATGTWLPIETVTVAGLESARPSPALKVKLSLPLAPELGV